MRGVSCANGNNASPDCASDSSNFAIFILFSYSYNLLFIDKIPKLTPQDFRIQSNLCNANAQSFTGRARFSRSDAGKFKVIQHVPYLHQGTPSFFCIALGVGEVGHQVNSLSHYILLSLSNFFYCPLYRPLDYHLARVDWQTNHGFAYSSLRGKSPSL